MDALEKIMLAAGQAPAQVAVEDDPAADLVAAASGLLTELVLELSKKDPDNDGDDDSNAKGDTDHDFWSKKGKKKKPLKAKGKGSSDDDESDEDEEEDEQEVKKKVKATALASAALLALSGLDSRPVTYDWVEATAAPLSAAESLALAASKGDEEAHPAPYGDVEYADPGYRGKKRYPIDAKHIHAALSYFSQAKNRAEYTPSQVKAIWSRIKSAARKHGVEVATSAVGMDALVALAGQPVEGGVPMHHGAFTGTHNHPHVVAQVHSHQHMHNGDSHHACGNGADGGRW